MIRIFGTNCTYLEPEQIIDLGAALLVGGKMTFPGSPCATTCASAGTRSGGTAARAPTPSTRPSAAFPELSERLDQPAGTLSGGEQQMLALARVMMTEPRLLMIDELALGLAPMTVERLMDIVRRVNEDGHHGHPGGAEREPRHEPGRARLLPRARRDPLRRPDRRAARPATTCCARVPGGDAPVRRD